MAIDSKSISSWVRQARYRAKKHNIYSNLSVEDVQTIIAESNNKCCYCEKEGEMLDCPFPLKNGGPNVPANVVLCCKDCKTAKSNNDVVWMFASGILQEHKYLEILQELFNRPEGDKIKDKVKQATGVE